MTQTGHEQQRLRIAAARRFLHCSIAESGGRRDSALNAAARENNAIALFEIRLQDMDKLEAELRAAKIKKEK